MLIFLIPLAILGCLQAMPDSSANGTTYDNGDYIYTEDDHYRVGDYVSTANDKTPGVLDSVPTANETISGVLVSISTANPTGTTRGPFSESKKETESLVYSTVMTTETDESTNESPHTSYSFPESLVDVNDTRITPLSNSSGTAVTEGLIFHLTSLSTTEAPETVPQNTQKSPQDLLNTARFVSASVTSGTDAYDRVVASETETSNRTTSTSKTLVNQTAPVTTPETSLSAAGIESTQSEASDPGSQFTTENPTNSSPTSFATTDTQSSNTEVSDTVVLPSDDYTAAPTDSSSNWTKHNKASLDDRTTRICLVIGVCVGLSALLIVLAIVGKICFDNYWLRKDYTNIDQDLQFIFQ